MLVVGFSLSALKTANTSQTTGENIQLAQSTSGKSGSNSSQAKKDYVDKINSDLREHEISKLLPHQLVAPACENCAPYIINCWNEITALTDLADRRTSGFKASMSMIEANGGNFTYINFYEIYQAANIGIIECAVFGGEPLQ